MEQQPLNDSSVGLSFTQRLKAAVHYTVSRICDEVGAESNVDVTFTRQFKAALAEATFRQSQRFSVDLELFAK